MPNVAQDKRVRTAYSKAARLAERADVARAAALEAAADADRLAGNIASVNAQRAALGRSHPSRAISRPAVFQRHRSVREGQASGSTASPSICLGGDVAALFRVLVITREVIIKSSGSARDFIRAIRESVIMAGAYEKHGFDPADCSMRINPPTADPLAGIDQRGRALVLCRQIDEPILEWVYLRRTRALALLTVRERAAFVNAVLDHPLVALDVVCEARSLFERSLRAARARDDAAIKVSAS
jgi:hypothetical protein